MDTASAVTSRRTSPGSPTVVLAVSEESFLGGSFDVDFNLAAQRHKLIAIERSSATGLREVGSVSPAGGR